MEPAAVRRAIFDALKFAAPGGFGVLKREAFLAGDVDIALADLDMDSLEAMEFCIELELSTGATLLPAELPELATTAGIERRILDLLRQ